MDTLTIPAGNAVTKKWINIIYGMKDTSIHTNTEFMESTSHNMAVSAVLISVKHLTLVCLYCLVTVTMSSFVCFFLINAV